MNTEPSSATAAVWAKPMLTPTMRLASSGPATLGHGRISVYIVLSWKNEKIKNVSKIRLTRSWDVLTRGCERGASGLISKTRMCDTHTLALGDVY